MTQKSFLGSNSIILDGTYPKLVRPDSDHYREIIFNLLNSEIDRYKGQFFFWKNKIKMVVLVNFLNFPKILIIESNLDFRPIFRFLEKVSNADKKFHFGSNIEF